MKAAHFAILAKAIEEALDKISEDGNPDYVYESLADDMTAAAELVYDACAYGQAFLRHEEGV